MIKCIFLDYTGTMVKEDEPYTRKLIEYFITHCDIKNPSELLKIVWTMIKDLEFNCVHDSFIMKDEMVDRILDYFENNYGLNGDKQYMHELWRNSWIYAPLYEDVKPFFKRIECPVYVVTNDDICYINQSLKDKELEPDGIISAEIVRACKPHTDMLLYGIELTGLKPEEIVFIGDSVTSDISSAIKTGITPYLIDRKHTVDRSTLDDRVTVINSLDEVMFS